MQTRAKFTCDSVLITPGGTFALNYDFRFTAVTSGSEENRAFWKYTSSGEIILRGVDKNHFEVGKNYYVYFTPVDPEVSSS